MELMPILTSMTHYGASDLFLSVGAPPCLKLEGVTRQLGNAALTSAQVQEMACSVMSEAQQREFEQEWEMNLAISREGLGRFRVNVYRQRGEPAMVVRRITDVIPTIEALRLPALLKDIVMLQRGLVLMVGATGSGKSTTVAAMIDHRNQNKTGHILTVEEPIEYVHRHRQSIVDQREIGVDTRSYANALKNAMREAPDVIVIGEIRDRETMQAAIAYADTGHLCLATLHASNANQAIDRIINFFPEAAKGQLLVDLSLNLKAVIGQRLLPGASGRRIPAVEVMLLTTYVSDLIAKGEVATIREAMKSGAGVGMKTFDQALYELYERGEISQEDAIANADSKTNLALQLKMFDPARRPGSGAAVGMQLEEPLPPQEPRDPRDPSARMKR